jgi:uncharacterized protein YlzI (FlbEa/FlbD family)
MKFIKFTLLEGYAVFINPEMIESIESLESNMKITLSSGKEIIVDDNPYEVVERIKAETLYPGL